MADNKAERQPDELGALSKLVVEFVEKFKSIENEIDLLKDSQKELFEEYEDKLDIKTLKSAMRTVKIKKNVNHMETYEAFCDILDQKECL